MYKEKKRWKGPYKFLGIKDKIVKALTKKKRSCYDH